jgi:tetratricopeptide (TPR) repeat protein
MEPVRVRAQETVEGVVVVEAYDAQDLLRQGNEALIGGDCAGALEFYERLAREFSESSLLSAALYNQGLCLGRLERLDEAVSSFLALVERVPESPDVKDALFQAVRCRERQERWADAAALIEGLLLREDLGADERLEAMTLLGAATVREGDSTEGERQLRRAIAFYRRQGGDAFRSDYYLAQAQYYLGEIPRETISQVELSNEERLFRIALERRCGLLLRAQTQYVQAIRVGNAHWAAASAYRIGEMYSSLYAEIMEIPVPEAEIPPDITSPEEIEIFRTEYPVHYRRILREYLQPLLHNAIRWWESNLMMVERTGIHGEWAERTRDDLRRVQDLLDRITADDEDQEPEIPGENGS